MPVDELGTLLLEQPDGKTVVASTTYESWDRRRILLRRYQSDGSPDTSFGDRGVVQPAMGSANSYGVLSALAVQPDRKILIAGEIYMFAGSGYPQVVARLNLDGTIDPTFGVDGRTFIDSSIRSLAVAGDGTIFVSRDAWNPASGTYDVTIVPTWTLTGGSTPPSAETAELRPTSARTSTSPG